MVDHIVAQTRGCAGLDGTKVDNRIPDGIQILFAVSCMADQDVVRDALARVGEAGVVRLAVVHRAGPAVRLHADGDVDLRHFQRAADIADLVVVAVCCAVAGDRGVLRRHRADARVEAAARRVGIGVIEVDSREQTVVDTLQRDLVADFSAQLQRSAVILLGSALGGDGHLLLIEEGEFLRTGGCHLFRDLVGRTGYRTGVGRAFNRLVQLPAGDRRTGQGEGVADLQHLRAVIRNFRAVHIHKVDGDGRALEGRVVEDDDVLRLVRAERQFLLLVIREVLLALIGYRGGQLDDRQLAVADFHVFLRVVDRSRGSIKVVVDPVMRLAGLWAVHEGDLVLADLQRDALGRLIRPHACDGDGVLGHYLIHYEVRVRDGLVFRDLRALGIHVVHGVAQRIHRPVRVNRGIRGDLGRPVEEFVAVRRGIPTIEGIAFLGRRRGPLGLRVLHDSLRFRRRRAAVHLEADGKARRRPLRVDHHVGSGHGVEGIRSGQPCIRIPAVKGVVAIHAALLSSGCPIVGSAADVRVKLDVGNGSQIGAAIEVVNLISVSVVVEVKRSAGVISAYEGETGEILGAKVARIRFVSLTVFLRSRISVVVRILQPIVYGIGIAVCQPPRVINPGRAAVRQHLVNHNQAFGYINRLTALRLPSIEIASIVSVICTL